jgi:hypothetical protein
MVSLKQLDQKISSLTRQIESNTAKNTALRMVLKTAREERSILAKAQRGPARARTSVSQNRRQPSRQPGKTTASAKHNGDWIGEFPKSPVYSD